MIFGENQVRQFYVLNGVSDTEALGNAKAYVKNGKFYAKYYGPDGEGGYAPIATDIVDLKCIRDIRISKPQPMKLRKWTIAFDGSYNSGNGPVIGEDYLLYFQIKDAMGFGDVERFYKNVVVHATTGMTTASFMTTLYNQLVKMLHNDKLMGSLLELDTFTPGSSISIVLKEKKQKYDRILNFYPQQAQIFINESKNITAAGQTTTMYWTTATAYDETTGIKSALQTNQMTNGYVIADMEDFFMRGRADMYGYNCTWCANPSDMVADVTKDYYVLDIKYFYQEDGMNNQNSEKEMTFACTSVTALQNLVKDITGVTTDLMTDSWDDDNFSYAYIHSQESLDKYQWMLDDYHAGGNTPNTDTWNGDGWVVALYKQKPGAGKSVSWSYDGSSPASSPITTTANSSYVILSSTDSNDGIGLTDIESFDKSKLTFAIS